MTDGGPPGRRRDRFLWWLLALSVAAVAGLSAVASTFWTAGHGAPVPASADVGPAAGGRGVPPGAGSVSGAPGPSTTEAPTTTTVPSPARTPAPVAAPATVVSPDRPVVQQTSTGDHHDSTTTTPPTSTSTTEPGEFGDTGYTTTSTLGGAVPGDR